jgi:TolA-binding protein
MTSTRTDAAQKFQEAIGLAAENLVVEAAASFREVVEGWPDSDLADDALYNVGACYLALNQFARAAETFQEVIERYPDATISTSDGRGEVGRTAAKAWLGLVAAQLGLGHPDEARAAVDRLGDYPDSRVAPPTGVSRTFQEIGRSLLDSALSDATTADQVTQGDVVA